MQFVIKKMKKLVIFLLAFSLLVFVSSGIFALSCSVKKEIDCAPSSNILLRLSDATNAHGAERDSTSPLYGYTICCNVPVSDTCSADGPDADAEPDNKIIGLSSSTNAHGEIPSGGIYTTNICYGDLSCISTSNYCGGVSTEAEDYPIPILSLSALTNAHIGGVVSYYVHEGESETQNNPLCSCDSNENTRDCISILDGAETTNGVGTICQDKYFHGGLNKVLYDDFKVYFRSDYPIKICCASGSASPPTGSCDGTWTTTPPEDAGVVCDGPASNPNCNDACKCDIGYEPVGDGSCTRVTTECTLTDAYW